MNSKFIVKKCTNGSTGKTEVKIESDAGECSSFVLQGKLAKRFVGISLIIEDLKDASWWLAKSHSYLPAKQKSRDQKTVSRTYIGSEINEDFRLLQCLFYSTIITYGKCFSSTNHRGIKLDMHKHLDKPFWNKHKEIIRLRNNVVAHAGKDFDSGEVIVAPHQVNATFHVAPSLWRLAFEDDRESEVGFYELLEHAHHKVLAIYHDILNKLLVGDARDAVIAYRKNGCAR